MKQMYSIIDRTVSNCVFFVVVFIVFICLLVCLILFLPFSTGLYLELFCVCLFLEVERGIQTSVL